MRIKYMLVKLVAKITGRKCVRCRHNMGGYCAHPNGEMFARCWQSITRPGYEAPLPAETPLTQEELHQLEKIVTNLQEASQTARDGGLLEE